MKHLFKFLSLCTCLVLFSCGGGSDTEDANLSPQERQAVTYVKEHLEKGVKLTDYKVVKENLPVEIQEQPFKQMRDMIFKAGLDYKTNQTRNLQFGMDMAKDIIDTCQRQINDILANLDLQATPESIIVYGTVKTKASFEVEPQGLIVAFNPETMEPIDWIPVTAPVQNNVGMIISASTHNLFDYAMNQDHDFKKMAESVSNPVLKFVLECKAI